MATKKGSTKPKRSTSSHRGRKAASKSAPKRSSKRTRGSSSKRSGETLVVVTGKGKKPSRYAQAATTAFRRGVQAQFADLARSGIATVAEVNGETVRAVPVKVGGRFVLREPNGRSSSSRDRDEKSR